MCVCVSCDETILSSCSLASNERVFKDKTYEDIQHIEMDLFTQCAAVRWLTDCCWAHESIWHTAK